MASDTRSRTPARRGLAPLPLDVLHDIRGGRGDQDRQSHLEEYALQHAAAASGTAAPIKEAEKNPDGTITERDAKTIEDTFRDADPNPAKKMPLDNVSKSGEIKKEVEDR